MCTAEEGCGDADAVRLMHALATERPQSLSVGGEKQALLAVRYFCGRVLLLLLYLCALLCELPLACAWLRRRANCHGHWHAQARHARS